MIDPKPGGPVAVIGLGNMGGALAQALLSDGRAAIVWNRTAAKAEPLVADGAAVAGSAVEAATAAAHMVVVCVTDHRASLSIVQNGEMGQALRGKLLVQLSTVTAEESRALGGWAEAKGIAYLDGSILGYPQNVRDRACTIVYSGPGKDFDANRDLLAALGGDPKHVGDTVGGAAIFDKTIYAYHYGSMLAFFHGAALCHAAGFPLDLYVDHIASSGARQKVRCAEMIATRNYDDPGCALEVEAAAYDHVVRLSEEFGIDSDFPSTVARYFDRAVVSGYGKQDLAAVFKEFVNQTG